MLSVEKRFNNFPLGFRQVVGVSVARAWLLSVSWSVGPHKTLTNAFRLEIKTVSECNDMSYFICEVGADAPHFAALESALIDVIPVDSNPNLSTVSVGHSRFALAKEDKTIPDRILLEQETESWIALLGTPLVDKRLLSGSRLFKIFRDDGVGLFNDGTVDGQFAALFYDGQRKVLTVATDFNTIVPIFYAVTESGLLLSSNELVLAKCLRPEIDRLGFAQAINLGMPWGEDSRFKGIKKMTPCSLLHHQHGHDIRIERYWHPEDQELWRGGFTQQLSRWMADLQHSVSSYVTASENGQVLADLTAGEDARLIVAQCYASGIDFNVFVGGRQDSADVRVATLAAKKLGFDLLHRERRSIQKSDLRIHGLKTILEMDGYKDLFAAFQDFATNQASPIDNRRIIRFGGQPGGEAFRGSYYNRGKAFFPSKQRQLDYRFFTKMKYLLDTDTKLTVEKGFLDRIYHLVERSVAEVEGFPIGTQIDHMLRLYQTSLRGLKYRHPAYMPFASSQMTRSIYGLSPRYKAGGRLTKAATEILWPELAWIKTQNGVPTVRKTLLRVPLFLPEKLATVRKLLTGVKTRYLKLGAPKKIGYSASLNEDVISAFLNEDPYRNWFLGAGSMVTGGQYEPSRLDRILERARQGTPISLRPLGRIIANEVALRWVYE